MKLKSKNILYFTSIAIGLGFFLPTYTIDGHLTKLLITLQQHLESLHDKLSIKKPKVTIVPFNECSMEHHRSIKDICKKEYKLLVSQEEGERLSEAEKKRKYSKICKESFLESKFKYIVEVNNKPAGFISYIDEYSSSLDGKCHIYLLGIKEEYRRQGLGATLMNYAINDLENKGCKKISLYVAKENKGAKNLYKKHDFVKRKRVKGKTLRMVRHQKNS